MDASGHDAPIARLEQDFYDRWPVATSISSIIESSPIEWSTRIGLFGKWGEGKTSVLNFLERQQQDAGNIVIKYSPWGVASEAELWKDFGESLLNGLRENGISIPFWTVAWQWVKVNAAVVKKAITGAGSLAQASGYAPGAKMGAELISNLIMTRLGIKREHIEALSTKLGAKRLVVFIDDLDRTDPAVIPKLLLVLRELLDFKRFVFILAFDREIISRALATYNESWSGENFLEKVIDFQITLPEPTELQIRRLAMRQFSALCPFVPPDAVDTIVKLLPGNPRKLKLLARSVSSVRKEVARHEANELDWNIILLLELFKLENDHLAPLILKMSTESAQFSWLRWGATAEARAQEDDATIDGLISAIPNLKSSRERIVELAKAWQQTLTIGNSESLKYQAMFALAPHTVTWGEFKEFFAGWRSFRSPQVIQSFIQSRLDGSHGQRASVQEDFAATVLHHHAQTLARVSHVGPSEAHKLLIAEASDTLDLFREAFLGANPLIPLAEEKKKESWTLLFGTALSWAHFVRNEGEPELRAKEQTLLGDISDSIGQVLALYSIVIPGLRDDSPFGADQRQARANLYDSILARVQDRALAESCEFVKQPKKISELRSDTDNQAARFLMTAPRSIAFDDAHMAGTLEIWNERLNTDSAADDALTFLEIILISHRGGDRYCTSEARVAFNVAHPQLVASIWAICISRQRQFRMLQEMRKMREAFVTIGIPEASLPCPAWLLEV